MENKNINKKERFANKANENKNSIGKEIIIQSAVLGLKETLKEMDDEDIKGNK